MLPGAHRRASRPALVLLQLLVFVTYIFGPTSAFAEDPTPEPIADRIGRARAFDRADARAHTGTI